MYIFKQPALITEQFLLPSGGKFYGSNFDGNITLRSMTTIEERMRLSASDNYYEVMSEIVNNCIVDNINADGSYKIDSKAFTLFDFYAICVKLRIISYGPLYKTKAQCLHCGEMFDYKADLRECEFVFVPDDFVEPYTIGPLPRSGDTLGCRFLRVIDKIRINKKAQEIRAKNPKMIGDPEYTLEMVHRIVTINGEDVDEIMGTKYVEAMSTLDSEFYHDNIDSKSFGVKTVGFTDCINKLNDGTPCEGKAFYIVRTDDEFFRASANY